MGHIVDQLLESRRLTKTDLARHLGRTAATMTDLVKRPTMDVYTVHKIGNYLKYNFFKHFPIEENQGEVRIEAGRTFDIRDRLIEEQKQKISELEKIIEPLKRDLAMQKQENLYLKRINELLEKAK